MKQLIFVVILLVVSAFLAIQTERGNTSLTFPKIISSGPSVEIDGHSFNAEVVKSQKDQEIGLTKYSSIKPDFGMYFPFAQEGYYPFWMKNMKFSIDMIFIDKRKVVDIKESVPPADPNQLAIPTYAPTHVTDGVLEISSGLSEKYGFKIGDSVQTSGF